MERLLTLPFEWVFPGHGLPWHAASPEAAHAELEALVAKMRAR